MHAKCFGAKAGVVGQLIKIKSIVTVCVLL